jgi:phospholipase C
VDGEGNSYAQLPIPPSRPDVPSPYAFQVKPDPKHDTANVLAQLDGNNGGFVKDYASSYPHEATPEKRGQVMGYFARGILPALHPLAEQFVVCDHWFSSLPGPTLPNRFFALSGTSMGRVRMPEGTKNLDMLWDQTQDTIFDRLRDAGRSWKVYFYDFPVSLLLRNQRHPENLGRYHKINRFYEDTRAEFPDFVLIEPKYFGVDQNDDHPPHNVMKAQKLVADVYTAIRSNAQLWESTLLVVVYDEHGGFYDHVSPPSAIPPDSHV